MLKKSFIVSSDFMVNRARNTIKKGLNISCPKNRNKKKEVRTSIAPRIQYTIKKENSICYISLTSHIQKEYITQHNLKNNEN